MRTRVLFVLALLVVPAGLTAQIRIPRGTRGTQPAGVVAPLPPEAPVVSRTLAYRRSRWSVDGYALLSTVLMPQANGGGSATYTLYGSGTRGSYRFTDRFAMTLDGTVSPLGSPGNAETVELGTRYSPMPYDRQIRPFIDVRAAYMNISNTYSLSSAQDGVPVPNTVANTEAWYSRGVGGIAGAGFDYSLTSSIALTTELAAMRTRMSAYGLASDPGVLPGAYWMTSYRVLLGFKYNPVTTLHLDQNPRQ